MRYDEHGNLVPNPNAEWTITDSTRDRLKRLEAKAFEQGWTPDELAEAIEEVIDDPLRARAIADTDLAMAQQAGSISEWRDSGVVRGKEWLLSNDHDFEDLCNDNADAGVVDLDQSFPSGDDTAPGHVHCECDVAAVIDEGSSDE